ncbi:MAG: hypothetical protein QXR17_04650 [Candidatus Bathyarchaeia archaeon]
MNKNRIAEKAMMVNAPTASIKPYFIIIPIIAMRAPIEIVNKTASLAEICPFSKIFSFLYPIFSSSNRAAIITMKIINVLKP